VARSVEVAESNDWKGVIILGYTTAARLMDVAKYDQKIEVARGETPASPERKSCWHSLKPQKGLG